MIPGEMHALETHVHNHGTVAETQTQTVVAQATTSARSVGAEETRDCMPNEVEVSQHLLLEWIARHE